MTRRHQDVEARQTHHYYFRNGTMDFAAGWVLGYAPLGGLSVGEVFDCLNRIEDGDPASWVRAFATCAEQQEAAARRLEADDRDGAADRYLACAVAACAVAACAAWHLVDPHDDTARTLLARLERSFQRSMELSATRLSPVTVQVTAGALPAYASSPLEPGAPPEPGSPGGGGQGLVSGRVWYVVIGGGDTFREDLYFFGGREALRRGYDVFLDDLPGQGSTPYQGLHFGRAAVGALREVLAVLHRADPGNRTVLTGYSGGGYFTAKVLEDGPAGAPGAAAWVASTPVADISMLLSRAMPPVLRRRSGRAGRRLQRLALRAAGPVDPDALDVPLLALVGLSEAPEARRQAVELVRAARERHPGSELVEFEPWTGADAHCQVNNLPLAQHHIFRWLAAQGLAAAGELVHSPAAADHRP